MITYIVAIIVGWLSGAVVNYISDVLPLRRRLTKPFCIQCDTDQSWPNFLFWPRKCPVCSHSRNLRVWIVEGFYIVASVLISQNPPNKLGYFLGLVVLAYFGVVVIIDLEYRLIMHPVSHIWSSSWHPGRLSKGRFGKYFDWWGGWIWEHVAVLYAWNIYH